MILEELDQISLQNDINSTVHINSCFIKFDFPEEMVFQEMIYISF